MKVLCCIPSRYGSTRLEGKSLLLINGKSIIQRVYERALMTRCDRVLVLTDSQLIYSHVEAFANSNSNSNGNSNSNSNGVVMVDKPCVNGTDRIIHYLNSIDHSEYDAVLNIQGDEPFFDVDAVNRAIDNFITFKQNNRSCGNSTMINDVVCSTICYKTRDESEIILKSRGKAVVDTFNNIIYCSRNVIPTSKSSSSSSSNNVIPNHQYNIHVGIFVFDKNYLLNYYSKENTPLQLLEDIEWLKIIEQGFKVNTIFTDHAERGIDTLEDYKYLCEKYKHKI